MMPGRALSLLMRPRYESPGVGVVVSHVSCGGAGER